MTQSSSDKGGEDVVEFNFSITTNSNSSEDNVTGPLGLWEFPLLNAITSKIGTSSFSTSDTRQGGSDEDSGTTIVNTGTSSNQENNSIDKQPVMPDQKINRPYQTTQVPNNGKEVEVLRINFSDNEGAIIRQIGNDWFPGMEFELKVDGGIVEDNIERQVAPTNNPQSINVLAEREVVWVAVNNGSEDRNVAAVADGVTIPIEKYEERASEYDTPSLV